MIVGLTGGIATGKSVFSRALGDLGLPVLDADVIAREVVEPGTDGLRKVVAEFGEEVLLPNGFLDRVKLGGMVFSDGAKRVRLNAIVHPLVRSSMWGQARAYVEGDASRIMVLDIPLLFENKMEKDTDVSVLVYAPFAVQLARLMGRNRFSEEEARRRIGAQLAIEEKVKLADVVVYNVGDEASVLVLAKRLFVELSRLAAAGARADGTFDRAVVKRAEIQL